MSSKSDKNIISVREYLKQTSYNSSKNYKKYPAISSVKYQIISLPNEVLVKIFDFLNIADLIKCSQVCKLWNQIANQNYFWSKWASNYKCVNDLEKLSELNESCKYRFMKYYCQKREILLFKLYSRISKKINKYTGLPDFKCLSNELSIEWCLEFLDKKKKSLFSSNFFEQNNFEASFSVIWSNFVELNNELVNEIEFVRISATIPIYIELRTGRLASICDKNSKSKHLNINTRKNVVREFQFSFNSLKSSIEKGFQLKKIFENSMIKLLSLNNQYLLGLWGSSKKNEIALFSLNMTTSFEFLERIFQVDNEPPKTNEQKKKVNNSNKRNLDLELDSKLGLHDYKVYMSIRNQTKTLFFSLSQDILKAQISELKLNGECKRFVQLKVLDCDMVNDVGPQLTLMPKFSWKTEFQRNDIDLLAIIDLNLFDSNNKLMLSKSFPVNCIHLSEEESKLRIENGFMTSEYYKVEFEDDEFILDADIICLKDEFTFSASSKTYNLVKLKIYLSLEFVDTWFGTQFQKSK